MTAEPDNPQPMSEFAVELKALLAKLPENPQIPYRLTPEGERLAKFKHACPEEFFRGIDRTQLKNPVSFDLVAKWDGSFPGPCATGPTCFSKTRAAWSALGRLWVKQSVGFSWWPVRKLITAIGDENGSLDGLLWKHSASKILFVDDVDKTNWQFESNAEALFAFYDHVYRKNIPCISTTNKDRKWWSNKMGDAFARRLFEDACREVKF
jgi:hypothetical protein